MVEWNEGIDKIQVLRYESSEKVALNGKQLIVIANLSVIDDGKKFKMFMTLIDKIAEKPYVLLDDNKSLQEIYTELLIWFEFRFMQFTGSLLKLDDQ